jgi:hypothetical protein
LVAWIQFRLADLTYPLTLRFITCSPALAKNSSEISCLERIGEQLSHQRQYQLTGPKMQQAMEKIWKDSGKRKRYWLAFQFCSRSFPQNLADSTGCVLS